MTGKQKRYERLPEEQHDLLVQLLRKEQHDPEILAEADRRDWRVTQKPFNIGTDGLPNELRNVVILYDKDYIRHEDLVDSLLSMTYNPLHAPPRMGIHEFLLTERGREYLRETQPPE